MVLFTEELKKKTTHFKKMVEAEETYQKERLAEMNAIKQIKDFKPITIVVR